MTALMAKKTKKTKNIVLVPASHETAAFTAELQRMLPMLDHATAVLRGMCLEHDRAQMDKRVWNYRGAANSLSGAAQEIRQLIAAAKTQPVAGVAR